MAWVSKAASAPMRGATQKESSVYGAMAARATRAHSWRSPRVGSAPGNSRARRGASRSLIQVPSAFWMRWKTPPEPRSCWTSVAAHC